MTQSFEKLEVVDEEVGQNFADIDVAVVSMKSFLKCGFLDQCRVSMIPVNFKTLWSRQRLGLNNSFVNLLLNKVQTQFTYLFVSSEIYDQDHKALHCY